MHLYRSARRRPVARYRAARYVARTQHSARPPHPNMSTSSTLITSDPRDHMRLATLAYLDAVRPDADTVLQGVVDDVRHIFGTDLCLINLVASDTLYFRAWSGDLPTELAQPRQMARVQAPCRYVVATEAPLVIPDLAASPAFATEYVCVQYGMRFYAGTPLITGDGHVIGSLCVLHAQPMGWSGDQLAILGAFARAAVGRIEVLGALARERAEHRAKEAVFTALRAATQQDAVRIAMDLQRTRDISLDIIAVMSFDGVIKTINPACRSILGYAPDEVIGHTYTEFVHPDDALTTATTVGTTRRTVEQRYIHKDGGIVWLEWNARSVVDEQVLYCVARDITERKRTEAALQTSEARHRAIVTAASDAIVTMTADGCIQSFNPGAERMFGYGAADAIGRPLTLLMPFRFRAAHTAGLQRYLTTGSAHILGRLLELTGQRRDGTEFPLELTITQTQQDVATIFVGILRDSTARKAVEAQLQHQAFHDPLTGLANRALFGERLQHALQRRQQQDYTSAVVFLDLDRFKVINDSLGHGVGDQLLRAAADRVQQCVRPHDTVARFGGDEFILLLEDIADVNEAVRMAQRVADALEQPFTLAGHDMVMTVSMGIALSTAYADRPDDLLRAADLAMYRAKHSGRARYEVFDPSMNAAAMQRLHLEAGLRRALERDELRVYYQPKVALATGTLVGMEALVRWQHPTYGLVSPATFIPLAEETGLILPLGRWVLETACRQAWRWQAQYPQVLLRMSVNLSARQFQHHRLIDDVAHILAHTEVMADRLQLEITESVMLDDADVNIVTLQKLKALGVRVALDDFGTGYSSLSYLKHFPLDTLKIDKTFVDGLGHTPQDNAIVQSVITLAHALGLTVTAEGVETAAQVTQLRAMGCELGQGYYWAKPLPSDAAEAYVARAAEDARIAIAHDGV